MNKKLVSKLAFIADKNVWLSVRLHLDCFPLEHLWLEFTTYTSISRFINYFTLLSNYHNDSKHSFLKTNSLFIYIWNLHFGIYLNKNILVNVKYKRQDNRPFNIPLFHTPQFIRSRVQVLFLVYRSGCCFYSTRVACTLELGLRENSQFKLSRQDIPLFYTPQFKRSRVQVLFLVHRSGCCFHSTRVACTLELGLRENGVFSLKTMPRVDIFLK